MKAPTPPPCSFYPPIESVVSPSLSNYHHWRSPCNALNFTRCCLLTPGCQNFSRARRSINSWQSPQAASKISRRDFRSFEGDIRENHRNITLNAIMVTIMLQVSTKFIDYYITFIVQIAFMGISLCSSANFISYLLFSGAQDVAMSDLVYHCPLNTLILLGKRTLLL